MEEWMGYDCLAELLASSLGFVALGQSHSSARHVFLWPLQPDALAAAASIPLDFDPVSQLAIPPPCPLSCTALSIRQNSILCCSNKVLSLRLHCSLLPNLNYDNWNELINQRSSTKYAIILKWQRLEWDVVCPLRWFLIFTGRGLMNGGWRVEVTPHQMS